MKVQKSSSLVSLCNFTVFTTSHVGRSGETLRMHHHDEEPGGASGKRIRIDPDVRTRV